MTNFKLIETASVESSNIVEVGYTDTNALFVLFKGGGSYLYLDVPKETYEELKKSESAGKFLNANIKPNYKFEALNKAEPKKKEEKVEAPLNEVTINQAEIVAFSGLEATQAILQILKDKGAPIKGIFLLEPDEENYNWERIDNPVALNVKIRWTKKITQNTKSEV